MQEYFNQLSHTAISARTGDDVVLCNFDGESTDFARINHNRIRQCGHVQQAYMEIRLIRDGKHLSRRFTVTQDPEQDKNRIHSIMASLGEEVVKLPVDPHFSYATEVKNTQSIHSHTLPPPEDVLAKITNTAEGIDLVGIYAGGDIFYGFANSLGQQNWFETRNFNFSYSLYHTADKAVQSQYAGTDWDPDTFTRRFETSHRQLQLLALPARTIPPGKYRVYLAPAALSEVIAILSWSSFGLKAHRTRTTPLIKLADEKVHLHPGVTMTEQADTGISPNFQSEGFVKPDTVSLIKNGRFRQCLTSPRSAREFHTETNGAGADEQPVSLTMTPGKMDMSGISEILGDGIYVNTLFYLNYSDRANCRITGMTRFATFWVENGHIIAPLNVMRFDESLYRILGENLLGLTREREHIASPQSYGRRATEFQHLPGALVKDFEFTL